MRKDLWEAIPLDVDPERVRRDYIVPVFWKWGDFEISRYTSFDPLKVKYCSESIGSHFLDLNSAKQYVFRFLETEGFPDAETNFKTLCNMTSFNCPRVYDFMKDYDIEIQKTIYDDEVIYTYNFEKMDLIKCDSIYEVAGCLQSDFLINLKFDKWSSRNRLNFIKKNTPKEVFRLGDQENLMKHYKLGKALKKYAEKW